MPSYLTYFFMPAHFEFQIPTPHGQCPFERNFNQGLPLWPNYKIRNHKKHKFPDQTNAAMEALHPRSWMVFHIAAFTSTLYCNLLYFQLNCLPSFFLHRAAPCPFFILHNTASLFFGMGLYIEPSVCGWCHNFTVGPESKFARWFHTQRRLRIYLIVHLNWGYKW